MSDSSRRACPVRPGAPSGVVVVVGVFSLLVSGCGVFASSSSRDGSVPPVAPTRTPSTPPDLDPVPEPVPGLVDVVAGRHERRVEWELVEKVPGPAVVVQGTFGGAPCDVLTGVDVDDSPEVVTITVWAGREPGARCDGVPALLGTFRLRVPLNEPLGTRRLEPGT